MNFSKNLLQHRLSKIVRKTQSVRRAFIYTHIHTHTHILLQVNCAPELHIGPFIKDYYFSNQIL